MMENGGGSIVNITSQLSEVTSRDFAHYSVTKAGGKMLIKDMAFDIAKKDVRVNTIGPGPTETGMTSILRMTGARNASVQVGGHIVGHGRSIHDAQALDLVHESFAVGDRILAGTHAAGRTGLEFGRSDGAYPGQDLVVDVGAQRIELVLHVGIDDIVGTGGETSGLTEVQGSQARFEQRPLQTQTPAPQSAEGGGGPPRPAWPWCTWMMGTIR